MPGQRATEEPDRVDLDHDNTLNWFILVHFITKFANFCSDLNHTLERAADTKESLLSSERPKARMSRKYSESRFTHLTSICVY